jgi:hypothetical protein
MIIDRTLDFQSWRISAYHHLAGQEHGRGILMHLQQKDALAGAFCSITRERDDFKTLR